MEAKSCWNCNHQFVCKGYSSFESSVSSFGYLRLDANEDGVSVADIYKTIASCCTEYQQIPPEVENQSDSEYDQIPWEVPDKKSM